MYVTWFTQRTFWVMIVPLTGKAAESVNAEQPQPAPLTDAWGQQHRPAGDGPRIVSLVPSITELLFDLRLGPSVVGRTAFCTLPEGQVRTARSVGGTKTVKMDKLAALEPTHIIVNIDETPRHLADELTAKGYRVVVTHPIEVLDNLDLYRLMGGMFGRAAEADDLCDRLRAAYDRLTAAAARWPERRVLYLIWKEPWMTVSSETYISRMLALARWRTVPEETASRYPAIALEEGLLSRCARVLFSSEPFPFSSSHLEAFRGAFPAHADKARLIDAQMVSWYGSRAIAGIDYLRRFADPQA